MEKLRDLRKKKRFSQQDLATHLKISQTQYQRKENGEKEMYDDEWDKLAKFLEVEVDDIKEKRKDVSVNQNFESVTNSTYVGSNTIYFSIPEFILKNQKEYIQLLKNEIESLKLKLSQKIN